MLTNATIIAKYYNNLKYLFSIQIFDQIIYSCEENAIFNHQFF